MRSQNMKISQTNQGVSFVKLTAISLAFFIILTPLAPIFAQEVPPSPSSTIDSSSGTSDTTISPNPAPSSNDNTVSPSPEVSPAPSDSEPVDSEPPSDDEEPIDKNPSPPPAPLAPSGSGGIFMNGSQNILN